MFRKLKLALFLATAAANAANIVGVLEITQAGKEGKGYRQI